VYVYRRTIVVIVIRAVVFCGEGVFTKLNQYVTAMKNGRKNAVSGGWKP
jgi:hypothetical protein